MACTVASVRGAVSDFVRDETFRLIASGVMPGDLGQSLRVGLDEFVSSLQTECGNIAVGVSWTASGPVLDVQIGDDESESADVDVTTLPRGARARAPSMKRVVTRSRRGAGNGQQQTTGDARGVKVGWWLAALFLLT